MDNEFELEWQKIKEKELNRLYSMFRTSVHGFFPDLSLAYNTVRVVESKIVHFQVRYDRWIEEVKTHFLQP